MSLRRSSLAGAALFAALLSGCRPDPALAPVQHADRLFAEGRAEEAIAAYEAIPESSGEWQAYGAWRAGVLYRDALHDEFRAEAALADCAKRFSSGDWGYACLVDLGDLRREARRDRPAIDAYRRAVDMRPKGSYTEHCLYHAGMAYLSLGEAEQARVEWKELLDRYPKSIFAPSIALERARSFDMEGDHKAALDGFRAVQEAHAGHTVFPLALFGEAEALEQIGRLVEAAAVYERALAVHPNPGAVTLRIERLKLREMRRDRPETMQPDSGRR